MLASLRYSAHAFRISLIALVGLALYATWVSPGSYPPMLGKVSLTAGLVLLSTAFHIAVCDALLRITRNSDANSSAGGS